MRSVARFSIRNSVLVHMLIVGVLLMGTWSFLQLPRELMSEISFNWVFLRVDLPSAAPQEIETQLALPIEEAIERVQEVSSINVRCKEGYAFFSIKFEQIEDDAFDTAYQQLKDEVGLIEMPDDAEEPYWLNFSSQDFVPMVQVVIAGTLAKGELYELAERVQDSIEDIDGIGKIEVGGISERQIHVDVDPDALAAAHMSLVEISQALARSNINVPGGVMEVGRSEVLLRTVGAFGGMDEVSAVVARTGEAGVVTVGDVADVSDTWRTARVLTRFEGEPAVTLSISKQSGGNSIDLIEQIRAVVDDYNEELTEDGRAATLSVTGDTSIQIHTMLTDLQQNALLGMILVVAVLWLFLGLRTALLTALGIPLAFLATFIFMWATGETLNGNSLFGLVLVLGIIVDDAIVLVENSVRHRALGKSREDAVVDGVGEVGVPVIAAILTTIAAFSPLMLMPGIMGKFLRIIPVVVAMALIASLVEALISLPVHVHEFGERRPEALEKRSAWFDRFAGPYVRLLRWLTDARLPVPFRYVLPVVNLIGLALTALLLSLAVPGILFAIFGWKVAAAGMVIGFVAVVIWFIGLCLTGRAWALIKHFFADLAHVRWSVFAAVYLVMVPLALGIGLSIPQDLFGGEEIPQAFVRVRMPEGTALEETRRVVAEYERLARDTVPEGELAAMTAHAGLLMTEDEWFVKPSVGQLILDFEQAKDRDRKVEAIVSELRPVLERVPGPDSMELVATKGGPPVGGDIELNLQGEDLDRLVELAEVVRGEMMEVAGVQDVRSDWTLGKTELRARVDEGAAGVLGVSERDVGLILRGAFDGIEATRYVDGDDEVPVLVRYAERFRNDLGWIARTPVPLAAGGTVPLGDIADIERGRSIDAIRRYKGKRNIKLSATVDKTVTTPVAATQEVQRRLAGFSSRFPGYSIDYSGEFDEFSKSLKALGWLGCFGMLLVYMILGAQFRSFSHPLVIIGFTFPGALLGAAVANAVTGTPLTLLTLYGVVALLGIVVNDSLVFVSFINAERRRGADVETAILNAGRVRLRPIVLTTVTTVFGLIPMAIGLGGQSDAWGPMATTIVFGLVVATATTLLVIPPVYRCVADLEELGTEALEGLGLGKTHPEVAPVSVD